MRVTRLSALPLCGLLLGLLSPASALASPDKRPVAEVVAELDRVVEAAWKKAGIKPNRRARPTEFLRRASLDVTGVIPREETVAAVRKQGKRKERRQLVIRALLHSDGYARFMATRWANLLVGRQYLLRQYAQGTPPLVRWLKQQFAGNTSWDVIARSLLTAEGKLVDNGATQYLLRYQRRPEEMTGNAMRVFQGQQVQCAQCHDHPYKKRWKQKDFWAVAAFFARAAQRGQQQEITLVERQKGEVRIPGTPGRRGPIVEPRFITGESIDPGEGDYRREELGRILTSKKNPWFARAAVNRVWAFFFGKGFTDPDDLAKPELPKVLAVLEQDFKQSRYDMRRLVEIILSSKVYQLSSAGPKKTKDGQLEVYARSRLRPLTAEQLWWSSLEATGMRETFANFKDQKQALNQRRQLKRRFFQVFGNQPDGAIGEHTLTQALMLLNGPTTNEALWLRPENTFLKRVLKLRGPDEQTTTLFTRVLGRPASRGERKALRKRSISSTERVQYLQDILWALMNSSEFLYNH